MTYPCAPARIHGLDTLRALAISLVVLHHYVLFVSHGDTFGWVGVDRFFALSGYLIGNQIFAALRSASVRYCAACAFPARSNWRYARMRCT